MAHDITYTADIDYHLRQYKTPYRSTVALIDFLKRRLDLTRIRRVLDLGCGGGANIHWLSQEFPMWEFTGVDFDPVAIEVCRQNNPTAELYCADIFKVNQMFQGSLFDLVLSIQVIETAPFDLYSFLDAALPLTKADLVLTSLFSEEYFEQETIRRDLKNNETCVYKIDSLKRLEDYTQSKDVGLAWEEFKIDQDLAKPKPLTLSTYTVTTADGERLQISPYMLMPWYAVHLKKR
jgi:predicted RNA methylase